MNKEKLCNLQDEKMITKNKDIALSTFIRDLDRKIAHKVNGTNVKEKKSIGGMKCRSSLKESNPCIDQSTHKTQP